MVCGPRQRKKMCVKSYQWLILLSSIYALLFFISFVANSIHTAFLIPHQKSGDECVFLHFPFLLFSALSVISPKGELLMGQVCPPPSPQSSYLPLPGTKGQVWDVLALQRPPFLCCSPGSPPPTIPHSFLPVPTYSPAFHLLWPHLPLRRTFISRRG